MFSAQGVYFLVRAVGAPFTFGIGAHPLIARLRQHKTPPQPPQLFSMRVCGPAARSTGRSNTLDKKAPPSAALGREGRKFDLLTLPLAPCSTVLQGSWRVGRRGRVGFCWKSGPSKPRVPAWARDALQG